ncbi:MAG: energy-coupled thiamine transporter ThiT [Clostridia bacterium]|nr:energy-coupled thiamine transporter ThiT [Clostridia bacterium]
MKNKKNLRVTAECAVLLSMSIVFSFIKIWQMPMGGEVTFVSMLPVMLAGFRNGPKAGFVTTFVYSLFQLASAFVSGNVFVYCTTAFTFIVCLLFDYIVPFTGLGFACLFKNIKRDSARFKNIGLYCGIMFGIILRFTCHYITGVVIWKQWAGDEGPYIYSLLYNGTYLLPELILTLIVCAILFKAKRTRKILLNE